MIPNLTIGSNEKNLLRLQIINLMATHLKIQFQVKLDIISFIIKNITLYFFSQIHD